MISSNITVRGGGCKFCHHFLISVQPLTRRVNHIFTVNKEDAIVFHSSSTIAPHSVMNNKSDPLCQHRSLHTDKKVIVWSATECRRNVELCTLSPILAFLPWLQCIQVIARSLVQRLFFLCLCWAPDFVHFTRISVPFFWIKALLI